MVKKNQKLENQMVCYEKNKTLLIIKILQKTHNQLKLEIARSQDEIKSKEVIINKLEVKYFLLYKLYIL